MTREPGTRYDLHVHSTRSDGKFEQGEVIERCAQGGLHVVALTDHDVATSLDPGEHRVGGRSVHLICGAEVSGTHEGREHHLLVYFPGEIPATFRAFCDAQVLERARRYDRAIANLGFSLPAAPATAWTGERAMTRLHLAHALIDAGHATTVADAFGRFLGDRLGKVPPVGVTFLDAIRLARASGGVTSWAHPSVDDAHRLLPTFAAAGLQGIETLRPVLGSRERRSLRKVARAHGVFVTGGSDWHGWHPGERLGLFCVHGHEIKGFLDALDAAA